MADGIRVAQEKYNAKMIELDAEVYAKAFYEKAGFRQVSDSFNAYGDIPYIKMMLWINE